MPWPKTGITNSLSCTDKGRAIKGLVVSYVVWLGPLIYGMGLWTKARCVGLVPCFGKDGYQAQVPQHPHRFIQMHTHTKAKDLNT